MDKSKIAENIIIAAFVILICCISLIWFPLQTIADTNNYEKRELAERPGLTAENYETFSRDYEAFFDDHIPFRNYLMTLNSSVDLYLFKRSSHDNVIIGKDHWLFYETTELDREGRLGDPIADYTGANLYSEEELSEIASNVQDMAKFMNDQGKEFVLFIAPDKERIYSEYMPDRYGKPSEMYRALQVVEYLRANTEVRVVYPYEELMEAKNKVDHNLYYLTDTHWNRLGGYVGACALLREFGIQMPDINDPGLTIETGEEYSGDLADFLHLGKQLKRYDHEYYLSGYDEHGEVNTADDFYGEIDFTAENADPRTIFVYRDSFASNMAPYVGAEFNRTVFRHRFSYMYGAFVDNDPDIFVYETIERYIDDLRFFDITAPVPPGDS